jgi:hypothetical protein
MGVRIFCSLMALFALVGCNKKHIIPTEKNIATGSGFYVGSTIDLPYKYLREDKSIALTNFQAPKLKLDASDVAIEIFQYSKCDLLGPSKKFILKYGKWGRVDFWDNRYDGMDIQDEYPFCRPPSKGNAYAFCAEKGGKAVAICIQQMTDDEAMAKQIFESFRWTE